MTKLYRQCKKCKKEFVANKNSLEVCNECEGE